MRFLLSLLSPALCLACGADARWQPPLCRACRAAMQPIGAMAGTGAMPGTGAMGGTGAMAGTGAMGASTASPWAAFAYEGPAGALVRALKFQGRRGVADAMAAQIVANAPPDLLVGAVVPVPVHRDHRRRRGIDHGAELGRAVAARAGLPFEPCLERVGDPLPQVGRGRRERIRGPRGAIRLVRDARAPETALVVDDVVTTGATLAACVRALTDAGSAQVCAIAYARTSAR